MADAQEAKPCSLTTQDGVSLEAELVMPSEPVASAVVCHPHPLYGGNMYNNVVSSIFATWRRADVAVLRFNFRGTGGSGGQHGKGADEHHDIVAAIDELSNRYPDLPLMVAGYSFGADVALAVTDDRPAAWFLVAPPLQAVPVERMVVGTDERRKVIVTGSGDDFRPPSQVAELTADWPRTDLVTAPGATHFFSTGLDTVDAAATELLTSLVAG